jgi:predicted RND superfamily exporter protein
MGERPPRWAARGSLGGGSGKAPRLPAVVADQALIQLQADQLKLTVLAIILILVVLLVGYRRPLPAILAAPPTVVAAGAATALLFLSGTAFDPASSRVRPAILASALAVVAGFAVLGLSPVPTVRDFGLWCAFDMMLATIAVLVLMPPLVRTWLR